MTGLLLYSCFMTPLTLALFDDVNISWMVINYTIDILFLIDIFVNFNTAIYDDDMEVIEDRGTIARNYLSGWFIIDLVAILPLDLIAQTGNDAN